jgi:hypothetical protein
MFEQQLQSLRHVFEESHPLATTKAWFQKTMDTLRKRD